MDGPSGQTLRQRACLPSFHSLRAPFERRPESERRTSRGAGDVPLWQWVKGDEPAGLARRRFGRSKYRFVLMNSILQGSAVSSLILGLAGNHRTASDEIIIIIVPSMKGCACLRVEFRFRVRLLVDRDIYPQCVNWGIHHHKHSISQRMSSAKSSGGQGS